MIIIKLKNISTLFIENIRLYINKWAAISFMNLIQIAVKNNLGINISVAYTQIVKSTIYKL